MKRHIEEGEYEHEELMFSPCKMLAHIRETGQLK